MVHLGLASGTGSSSSEKESSLHNNRFFQTFDPRQLNSQNPRDWVIGKKSGVFVQNNNFPIAINSVSD